MTTAELEESLKPLCNLSIEDALSLLSLADDSVDWVQVQKEAEEFTGIASGGSANVNLASYAKLFEINENIRRDLFEKDSIKRVFGDVSNFIKEMQRQLNLDQEANRVANSSSIFTQNISTNSRLAFAAFQRVVCGRNMSADQLFSDGGEANSFDQLRDQLKEKDDDEFVYRQVAYFLLIPIYSVFRIERIRF